MARQYFIYREKNSKNGQVLTVPTNPLQVGANNTLSNNNSEHSLQTGAGSNNSVLSQFTLVNGSNNNVSVGCTNITIQGNGNKVESDCSNITLIGDNLTVRAGVKNTTIINVSNRWIGESNVTLIGDILVRDGIQTVDFKFVDGGTPGQVENYPKVNEFTILDGGDDIVYKEFPDTIYDMCDGGQDDSYGTGIPEEEEWL